MNKDIEAGASSKATKPNHHFESRRRPVHEEIKLMLQQKASNDELASSSGHRDSAETAPISRGLPLTTSPRAMHSDPRLIHPVLLKIPLQLRFGFNGIMSNVLFMVVYNWTVSNARSISPSTVYSVVYFFFIPLGHAMVSLFVFGWPERYFPSLLSNFPIGLTAIAIGGGLTAYLDYIHFNESVAEYIRDNFTFTTMPARDEGEFYSSIVVLVVTSLWTYVLSVYVNSPPAKSDKKEL